MKYVRYWILLCGLALILSTAHAGSDFYLTIDRSFSNTEKPKIRVDYTNTDIPILIRVLKPKNLETFLEGQLQISRSYEVPVLELNPGHYFVKGLNKLESPIKTFRDMLDVEFRKSFKNTQVHKSILNITRENAAAPPEKLIIGPPAGFTIEREFFMDVQQGGKTVNDLGWWFYDTGWDISVYKVRTITLEPLPDGIYLIHAVQGKTEAQSLLQVSSLSIQVKQSTSQLVTRVMDRQLNLIAGATVSYRDGRGKWIAMPNKTDATGEVFFSNPEGILDGRLIIKTETSDHRQALTETDFLPSVTQEDSVYIVTDRPIFKPGETFYYKGVIRSFSNGQLYVPNIANQPAAISLIRTNGDATDHAATVQVTDFGTFSGSFDLDEQELPGLYRLVANIADKPYGGEFRIRDYVKPVFYLELIDRSPTVAAGSKFFVKFLAKRYSGGVLKNLKYEVYLYRKKFEVPQWIMEAGAGLSAGTDYFGEIRSVSGLTEPKRIYSSLEERLGESVDVSNPWDTAPETDDSGIGQFEFIVPKTESESETKPVQENEWTYTLMIRAMERTGAISVLTENIFVTLSEAQAQIRFSKTIAEPIDKDIKILVRSTYPDGKVAPGAGGTIDIVLDSVGNPPKSIQKLAFTTDEKGTCVVDVPTLAGPGRYTAKAVLETLAGKHMRKPSESMPTVLIVGGSDGSPVLDTQEVELYCENTILTPGEKAKIFAVLPTNWGKAETGVVWETISGQKIYVTKATEVKGRSRWFEVDAKPEYGTGFYHTLTVPVSGGKYREKTMGFRIIPIDKRLQIAIRPEREQTAPLKPFKIDFEVKDSAGNPTADAELAVTIVDRAVYAVQGELRPGIFDFFYPLPRQNLSTFYSDELQGYGYADTLKKPNFKLGALKSQSQLVKKNMRDTAGWFPHVRTDTNGRASVTVNMPANITEWVITAIAVNKDGKVGEMKAGFRTASDVIVEAVSPQFLRKGETAQIFIKASNRLPQVLSVKAHIKLSPEINFTDSPINQQIMAGEIEFKIEKTSDYVIPLEIEAVSGTGRGTIQVELETKEPVLVGGINEFEIPLKPAAMVQVFSGSLENNRMMMEVPAQGTPVELKVQIHSGLLGAALTAASTLVSYPFGCTEQLVHSTIPNLVLMDLIRNADIDPKELGPLSKTLVTAQKNASAGIRKILLNQKQNGGFGLWQSDPAPSVSVTLTALYALKFATDLEIEGASRGYSKGCGWISHLHSKDSKYLFSGYELAKFAELSIYNQPYEQMFKFIDSVNASPEASVVDIINALKIFAAHKDIEWNRLNQRYKNSQVRTKLVDRLQKLLNGFDTQTYLKAVNADMKLYESMGFSYGIPYVISSGMGVLNELNALPKELEKKLKYVLLKSMKNGYWISTFDTAQVIFNTRAFISAEAMNYKSEKEKIQSVTVYSRDGLIGNLQRIPAGFIGVFSNLTELDSLSEISVKGVASTDVGYSTLSASIPFESVRPKYNGLIVERAFFKITANGNMLIDSSQSLTKGDIVISKVHVKRGPVADTSSIPSEFIVVEDAIPSYAECIEEDKPYLADANINAVADTYWASIKEVRRYPDKTVTIAKIMPSGELTVYQVWRVSFDGKASVSPARAYDMYNESICGNSDVGLVIELMAPM